MAHTTLMHWGSICLCLWPLSSPSVLFLVCLFFFFFCFVSMVLCQVDFGRPIFHFPPGCHINAVVKSCCCPYAIRNSSSLSLSEKTSCFFHLGKGARSSGWSILKTWPIHVHLCCMIISLAFVVSVLRCNSSFDIKSDLLILDIICLKHLFWNVSSFFLSCCVAFHVSLP